MKPMNSGKERQKERNLPPDIHRVSRESLRESETEEFIEPEATPSRDMHDIPCPRCGKERGDWTGPGVQRGEEVYCSKECAEGKN